MEPDQNAPVPGPSSSEGKLFWFRLRACIKAQLLPSALEAFLFDGSAPAAADATDFFEKTRLKLRQYDLNPSQALLERAFSAAHPEAFDAVRVLTRFTYDHYYSASPVKEDDDASASIGVSLFDRDPDHLAPASATGPVPGIDDALSPLLDVVALAPADGLAFITDFESWQLNCKTASSHADASVTWLGLPFAAGTGLIALQVNRPTDLGWATCRRPTVIDAMDSAWWLCWTDDPLHHGHTFDLSNAGGPVQSRGAKEWVVKPVQIDTTAGHVLAHDLGRTAVDTLPASQVQAGKHLLSESVRQSL